MKFALNDDLLATQAGVAKRTVERLEAGAVATQLSGFIRVCRVLDLIERFDLLVPEPVPSPVAQLKMAGRKRQRASTARPAKPAAKKWRWGLTHDAGRSSTLGTNHWCRR
jgi:hypothetical protein